MTPSLKISQKVLDRLSKLKQINNYYGKIYGIFYENNLIVLDFEIDLIDDDGNNSTNDLLYSFPAEVDVCGLIEIGHESHNENSIKERFQHDIDVTDNPIFLHYQIGNENGLSAWFFINDRLDDIDITLISEQEIYSQFIHINLTAYLPLSCNVEIDSIRDSFTGLRKMVASGVMGFNFNQTNIYLMGNDSENGLVGIAETATIRELLETSNDSNEGSGRKKKQQQQQLKLEILEVNMLKRVTRGLNTEIGGKIHAPLYIFDKKQQQTINTIIAINALTLVNKQLSISNLYEILVESAIRNLRLYEKALLNKLENDNNEKVALSEPEIYHFYPEECGHFLTLVYLKNDSDNTLINQREKLHKQLLLSMHMPIFRRGNKYVFKEKTQKSSELLINPHEGVKQTNNDGEIVLVKGKYAYYHYCQNKVDDNGWGCAYRSLQTLTSWFKLQGFTEKDVPTFKEIQKCLVDIGDKPSNFIDSRQWIGSTEVNFVLHGLFGIVSKILYVNSGEEMATKGPELVDHFKNQGTPVMIGGGVLAHTILGVDYNQQTGNLKFLILDPHYTGAEDIDVILKKGWCGWKGVDFWNKTAYYNMCLPQVIKGI